MIAEHNRLSEMANTARVISGVMLVAMTVTLITVLVLGINTFSESAEAAKSIESTLEDYEPNY